MRNIHRLWAKVLNWAINLLKVSHFKYVISHTMQALQMFLYVGETNVRKAINLAQYNDVVLAKMDVVSLYPNVILERATNTVVSVLMDAQAVYNKQVRYNMLYISKDDHQIMLDNALLGVDIRFKDSLLLFNNGVPIGSPLVPPVAIIAMHKELDTTLIEEYTLDYGAYVDDNFGLFALSEQEFTTTFVHSLFINHGQPRLTFSDIECVNKKYGHK